MDHHDRVGVYQNSPGLPHTYAATDGIHVALQLQNCEELHRMFQDIALPTGVTTISWEMEYNNHHGSFVPGQQEMAITIRDPTTDAILATPFVTTQGVDPLVVGAMTTYTVDVSAFGGQTVRFSVDHQVQLFFFDAAWDNFRVDNLPPDCSGAVPSTDVLWPPNHQFAPIDVLGVIDPEGEPVTINIDAIFQDEPTDTYGDGRFTPDGMGVGTSTAQVRAERAGTKKVPGNGRVYHISFTAADPLGATCSGTVLVGVPHDQAGDPAVDDGPLYDSTVP